MKSIKRKPGRPKGSKKSVKRRPGRPKGSKNKQKLGRPKGVKSKRQDIDVRLIGSVLIIDQFNNEVKRIILSGRKGKRKPKIEIL